LSASKELEELQNKRAGLKEESRSLKEEQKDLEERVKVLEEKIAVEELKNSNKAACEAISHLESKINELEERLKKTSQVPETPKPTKEIVSEVDETTEPTEKVTPEIEETMPEEPEEEAVTVTALEDSITASQEEVGEDLKKPSEKKKRKFF